MAKEGWKEPKNKTVWLADLIEAGEAAVKGYEKYLLNQIDYTQLARLMTNLRNQLPMDIDDKMSK
jgi:hypothetical protein